MADVFEKAKRFVSDSAKTKGNCNFVKYFFLLKSTKAHLFNICNGENIGKKMCSVLIFSSVHPD